MASTGIRQRLRELGHLNDGAPPARCPHCGDSAIGGWGAAANGRPRWRCRVCKRTCSKSTGTALAGIHVPDAFMALLDDMDSASPRSCRVLAKALDLDWMTVWRWRRKVMRLLARARKPCSRRHLDASQAVIRESRKASREWVRHEREPDRHPPPDRHRWIDYRRLALPLPDPMTPYLIPLMLGQEPEGRPIAERPGTPDPLPHRSPAASPRAERDETPAPAADTSATLAFRDFMQPFRGPATRHLDGYLAWFNTKSLSPPRLAAACFGA